LCGRNEEEVDVKRGVDQLSEIDEPEQKRVGGAASFLDQEIYLVTKRLLDNLWLQACETENRPMT